MNLFVNVCFEVCLRKSFVFFGIWSWKNKRDGRIVDQIFRDLNPGIFKNFVHVLCFYTALSCSTALRSQFETPLIIWKMYMEESENTHSSQ